MPMWITYKKMGEDVKTMNILKKAGYKINLPFGSECELKGFPKGKPFAIISVTYFLKED